MKEIELLGKKGNKTKNEINLKGSERIQEGKQASKGGRQAVTLHSTSARVARSLVFFTHRPAGAPWNSFFSLFSFFSSLFVSLFSLFSFSFFFLSSPLGFFLFLRLLSYSLAVSSRSLPLAHTQAHTHTHTKDEHDAISGIITGDVTPWVAQFQNPAQELRVFDGYYEADGKQTGSIWPFSSSSFIIRFFFLSLFLSLFFLALLFSLVIHNSTSHILSL